MSYNNHYGGFSGPNSRDRDGPSERGRDRDRDRDRLAYGRYPGQKQYGSSSNYPENASGGYRRDARDYYGQRNGYRGTNSGPSSQVPVGLRRRTEKYDLYQGSKYRPANKGKPAAKSLGPWNGLQAHEQGSYYSGRKYEDHYGEQSHDLADNRRLAGRKQEWDPSVYHMQRMPRQRDQYKPENRERDSRDEHDEYDRERDHYDPYERDTLRRRSYGNEVSEDDRTRYSYSGESAANSRGNSVLREERLALPYVRDEKARHRDTSVQRDKLHGNGDLPTAAQKSSPKDRLEEDTKDTLKLGNTFEIKPNSMRKDGSTNSTIGANEAAAPSEESSGTNKTSPEVRVGSRETSPNVPPAPASEESSGPGDSAPLSEKTPSSGESASISKEPSFTPEGSAKPLKEASQLHKEPSLPISRESPQPSKEPSTPPFHETSTSERHNVPEAFSPKAESSIASAKSNRNSEAETIKSDKEAESDTFESGLHSRPTEAVKVAPPDSPTVADSSMLSPVGSPHDFTLSNLGAINEDGNVLDVSEAETIIAPPSSMDVAKKLIRKGPGDEERRKLKRSRIYCSEDDEDDDSLPQTASETPEPGQRKPVGSPSDTDDTRESDDDKEPSEVTEERERRDKKSAVSGTYKIKRDSTGRSPLQRACKKGDLSDVKRLIKMGASANECDFGGFSCLHEAALAGHTSIVKYLIEHGADVNKQSLDVADAETPLMDAAENQHIDIVKLLLKHGANPNIRNVDGYSVLAKLCQMHADDEDYEEIIKVIDAACEAKGEAGLKTVPLSPLNVVEDPTEEYFSNLVKRKSNHTIYRYISQGLKESAAEDFVTHGYSLQKMPDILNVAARTGGVELVDILLGLNPGAFDINQVNKIGITPLLAAAGRGHYDVVKFLLSKGADPLKKRKQDGMDALQISKHSAQYDTREVLLLEESIQKLGKSPKVKSDTKVKVDTTKANELQVQRDQHQETKDTSESGDRKRSASFGEQKPKRSKSTEPDLDSAESKVFAEPEHDAIEDKHEEKAGSLSPPKSKAQEEQKQRAAVEAKIWQEKVQAKKRARREMFLQAEKEKERKRKEDEEKRLKDLKLREKREQEEKVRKAQEETELARKLERQQEEMERRLIFLNYPIGLREAFFDSTEITDRLTRYSPLYVMESEGDSWVLDLQVALITSQTIPELHKQCEGHLKVLDSARKEKIWPVFYRMLGVGRNLVIDPQGLEKFKCLQLLYLRLSEVAAYIQKAYPFVYELIWSKRRITRVSLEATENMIGAGNVAPQAERKMDFVPPKWRQRQDVVRTIKTANYPMW